MPSRSKLADRNTIPSEAFKVAMDGWRREREGEAPSASADAFRVVIDEGENAIRRRAPSGVCGGGGQSLDGPYECGMSKN